MRTKQLRDGDNALIVPDGAGFRFGKIGTLPTASEKYEGEVRRKDGLLYACVKTGASTWAWQDVKTAVPGMVFITGSTFSAVSSFSVDNCFTSTYDNYRVVLTLSAASTTSNVGFRFRTGGSDASGASYDYMGYYLADNATGALFAASGQTSIFFLNPVGAQISEAAATFDVFRPHDTEQSMIAGQAVMRRTDALSISHVVTGTIDITTSYDGFTLFASAGTITGIYRVYGYRDS